MQNARYPAFVVWGHQVYENAEALLQIGDPKETALAATLVSASGEALRRKRVGSLAVGDRRLLVVPFLSMRVRRDVALVADVTLGELPEIFAHVANAFTAWSEVLDELPGPVLTARPHGEIDFWNRRWRDYTGKRGSPSLETVVAAIAAADVNAFTNAWREGIARTEEFSTDVRLRGLGGDERWHQLRAKPILRDGRLLVKWLISLADVHDARLANERLERSQRDLRFLADSHRALASSLDVASVAEAACRYAAETLQCQAAILFTDEPKQLVVSPDDGTTRRLFRRVFTGVDGRGGSVAEPARPHALFPLRLRHEVLGSLCVAHDDLGSDTLSVIAEFARNVATAIDNARMYERERRTAVTLQRYLLPAQLEQPRGVHIEGAYAPRDDEAKVGGDWYDAFVLRDGTLALTIGDVAGTGVQAAALMGALRQSIRSALWGGASPAAALQFANSMVYGAEPDFATAWVAVVDLVDMTIRYAAAGHPPPLELDGERSEFLGGPSGPPLGTFESLALADRMAQLPRSAALVLYTDGMIEYAHDVIAGLERLETVAREWARSGLQLDAQSFAAQVFGEHGRRDDAALLLVRFQPVRELDVTVEAVRSQSPVVRRMLMRFVRDWDAEEARAHDIVLSCCEALNNAIEHAYERPGNGTVRVRAAHEGGALVFRIDDAGRWREPQPNGERGRGLVIVGALADEVEVCRNAGGTSVRIVFALDAGVRRGAAGGSELALNSRT